MSDTFSEQWASQYDSEYDSDLEEYEDEEDEEQQHQEYPHLSYYPQHKEESKIGVWEEEEGEQQQQQQQQQVVVVEEEEEEYVFDPNDGPEWPDEEDEEDQFAEMEEDEQYVEVDPRDKYKGAKPTQTAAPQSFLPTTSNRRSLGKMLKVPRRLSFGRKTKPQGDRPAARPMTMAHQPGPTSAARAIPSPPGRRVPRPINAARPMTMARQPGPSARELGPTRSPADARRPRASPSPGGRPGPRPMTMAIPSASRSRGQKNVPPQAPARPLRQNNLRVQAAVNNVQAPKQQAVQNVAKSFESRGNLARAKAKPVQVKYKANAGGRSNLTAMNPMYRS